MIKNIKRFSFAELTSNNDGKTSGSGTCGVLLVAVGALGFIAGVVDSMVFAKGSEIISASITVMFIGAGLLGLRKWSSKNDMPAEIPQEEIEIPLKS